MKTFIRRNKYGGSVKRRIGRKLSIEISEEYQKIVLLAKKQKLDFKIVCCARHNRDYIISLFDNVERLVVDGVEYTIGDKYQILLYNYKYKTGEANFNNKPYWRAIKNLIEELR